MRGSRGITVKLPKDKVIKTLQAKLKEYDKKRDAYPALKAEQDRKHEAWKKSVLAAAKKNFANAIDTSVSYSRYGQTTVQVSLTFTEADIPKMLEQPSLDNPDNYHFKEEYEDITQAIRLLQMSDDEYVSASTYKSIVRYL